MVNASGDVAGVSWVNRDGVYQFVPALWSAPGYARLLLPGTGGLWGLNERGMIGIGRQLLIPTGRLVPPPQTP